MDILVSVIFYIPIVITDMTIVAKRIIYYNVLFLLDLNVNFLWYNYYNNIII